MACRDVVMIDSCYVDSCRACVCWIRVVHVSFEFQILRLGQPCSHRKFNNHGAQESSSFRPQGSQGQGPQVAQAPLQEEEGRAQEPQEEGSLGRPVS